VKYARRRALRGDFGDPIEAPRRSVREPRLAGSRARGERRSGATGRARPAGAAHLNVGTAPARPMRLAAVQNLDGTYICLGIGVRA
jgi:hypothetical protein